MRAAQSFIKTNDRKGRYTLPHFWQKCKKVKNEITGIMKQLCFSFCEYSFGIYLQILKTKNFNQNSRRTLGHHLGEVWQKKDRAAQNLIKEKMTGDIIWRIFEKSAKKIKIRSQEQKNTLFLVNFPKNCAFLGPVNSIWTLMQFSQKCGNFVIYEFLTLFFQLLKN